MLLTLTLFTPAVASAQSASKIDSQTGLTRLSEVPQAIVHVMIIFLPGVATLYLVLSGYRYIIAQGNPDLIEKAKKSLTYAVYGVILAYASVAIIVLLGHQFDFDTGL
jgi:hypothetical protein